jgi:hypothetical protein
MQVKAEIKMNKDGVRGLFATQFIPCTSGNDHKCRELVRKLRSAHPDRIARVEKQLQQVRR